MSDDSVTVTGRGSATGTPDVLSVRLALVGTGPRVDEALDAASAAVDATTAVLRRNGLNPDDIRTGQIQVYQRYDDKGEPRSFESRQTLMVTLREVDASGRVLREIASAAPRELQIDNVTLAISDPAPLRVQAREGAFADARATAEQLAGLAGRRVGAAVSIVEPDADSPGGVWIAQARSAKAVPVEVGEQDVTASVTVTWRLAD